LPQPIVIPVEEWLNVPPAKLPVPGEAGTIWQPVQSLCVVGKWLVGLVTIPPTNVLPVPWQAEHPLVIPL
jgi:hypothetical protein